MNTIHFDTKQDNILAFALQDNKLQEGTNKTYQHTLSGTIFSHENFQLPVVHKRTIKSINWKDLGDKMQVFIKIPDRETYHSCKSKNLDQQSFNYAFDLFQSFDEETGEKYSFLYKIKSDKIKKLTPLLEAQHIKLTNKQHIFIKKDPQTTPPKDLDMLSFLFGLFVIYGNFQTKANTILGAKIFIPLFGAYTQLEDFLNQHLNNLTDQYYFISKHLQETNDGNILQLSITDHELLQIFATWYERVEKFTEITKLNEVEKAKALLLVYCETEDITHNIDENTQFKLVNK
ncbi:MAG: hypothetical protein CR971_01195 [candidate division SR1 bacterium]|nr:MAG: hypothetical protein CR971_01195 [candidate division SR1 bacterium]